MRRVGDTPPPGLAAPELGSLCWRRCEGWGTPHPPAWRRLKWALCAGAKVGTWGAPPHPRPGGAYALCLLRQTALGERDWGDSPERRRLECCSGPRLKSDL